MVIKNKRIARERDVWEALKACPFTKRIPGVELKVVTPRAYPSHKENKGRKHRAYIKRLDTGQIILTANLTWELVEKIKSGMVFDPDKKEGLLNLAPPLQFCRWCGHLHGGSTPQTCSHCRTRSEPIPGLDKEKK